MTNAMDRNMFFQTYYRYRYCWDVMNNNASTHQYEKQITWSMCNLSVRYEFIRYLNHSWWQNKFADGQFLFDRHKLVTLLLSCIVRKSVGSYSMRAFEFLHRQFCINKSICMNVWFTIFSLRFVIPFHQPSFYWNRTTLSTSSDSKNIVITILRLQELIVFARFCFVHVLQHFSIDTILK